MFDGWLYLLIDGHLYNLPKIIFMEMISFSLNVDHQAQLWVTIGPRPIARICDPKAGWLIWSRVDGSVQTLADRPLKQTNNTASNLCDKALCQTSRAQWSGFRNLAVRVWMTQNEWAPCCWATKLLQVFPISKMVVLSITKTPLFGT